MIDINKIPSIESDEFIPWKIKTMIDRYNYLCDNEIDDELIKTYEKYYRMNFIYENFDKKLNNNDTNVFNAYLYELFIFLSKKVEEYTEDLITLKDIEDNDNHNYLDILSEFCSLAEDNENYEFLIFTKDIMIKIKNNIEFYKNQWDNLY